MRRCSVLMAVLVFLGVLAAAGESQAVIYQYVNEKGDPIYVDDLTKVPEQEREKAVIVTGREEQEVVDDAERLRALGLRQASADPQALSPREAETFQGRLLRSAVAVVVVTTILFVMLNIDAVKERHALIRKTRMGLIAALVLFVGFTHAPDVLGLFGNMGAMVSSPVVGIKEKQAEKGRKAAEARKTLDDALQERVQQEVERVQKQFDEAERGK